MQQQFENWDFARNEEDYLRFILTNSQTLQQDWDEIQAGSLDMSDIITPLYKALGQDNEAADAAAANYQENFLSYLRSHNSGNVSRLERLRARAEQSGIRIPSNLYAGSFQLHSFNAEAFRSGQTNLMLVHSGLENVLVEATRLLFAIHQKTAVTKAERLPDPVWLADATVDALIFDFAQILASFVASESPVPMFLDEHRYPFEADKEIWAFSAAASAQDFVLAHELGHVALGHLDEGKNRHARVLRSGVKVFGKSQIQEFAADRFAIRLLFGGNPPSEEQKLLDLIYGKYLGVGIFFDLDDLVAEIERRAFDLPESFEDQSHPPPRSREASILDVSRNCSAPLTWYFAKKEKHHGTETNPRIPRRGSARSVDERVAA